MIITCASCLTKFNLDDSRIPAEGIKVRCSRCKHIFFVVPPPETKEEIIENFESFAKYHEELMEPGEKKEEASPEAEIKKKEAVPEEEEEETFLFSEKTPAKKAEELSRPQKAEKLARPEKEEKPAGLGKAEELAPPEELEKLPLEELLKEERVESKPSKPKSMIRAEQRGPSRFFALLIVLALLIFGVFYVWSELSSGGRLFPYLEYPVKKITEFWNQIWGIEKGDLVVEGLSGYEERIGEVPLFIIEGKVKNQSNFTKKHIKVKVVIFDQDKLKVAEKEAICGRIIDRGELKKQPMDFFKGEMVIKPQTKEEMITRPDKTTPFMVIFKDPPSQAKEFKVEIVEAPNL
jgi:predicted Zn finger-like uncharacterized protein